MKIRTTLFFCGFLVAGFMQGIVLGQSTPGDSTNSQLEITAAAKKDSVDGELIFDTIEIKGKVEKPGVIVIPKRLEPEMKEVELTRSFTKEVKEGVGEIMKPEKELRKVDRVESIKKTVERKRK